MTDEELAEEYVMNHVIEAIQEQIPYFNFGEQMFLAGLKAGRQQWHDLRKNPNDLPKENMKQVIVKLSDGSYEMGYYCIHNNSWWANDCPDYDDELGYYDYNTGEKIYPIKWKEIE